MSEREATVRTVVVTYFPMFIATLSLVTSIFNGYLNNKFVDIIQRNFTRAEYLKTCKEIIDAYFQVKFRAAIVSEDAARERARGATAAPASMALIDAENAVNKFAALGTYLANLRDDATREQYTISAGSSTRSCAPRSIRPQPISTSGSRLPTGCSRT